MLIHGLSGCGKSSLVRAGVLPKLALQYGRHDAPWLTCAMRPSGGPIWNLAVEFARLEGREGDVRRISALTSKFDVSSVSLASVAAELECITGKSLCILVDQFEELFRYEKDVSRDEAELFVDLIERAAAEERNEAEQGPVDLHVIVTMRSEFLGECARFAGFAETINRAQYLVPGMDDDGLMRAVRRPAQMYRGEFGEGVAERLIGSVRGCEDELPLLQHGLMLMWEDAVQRAGKGERVRLDGAIVDEAGGLAELLSGHADRVMASVAPDERRERIVEAVFRALTDVNAEGSAIRRPLAFPELCAVTGATPDELCPVLDGFRAQGVSFLTPYAPLPIAERLIDISHEALIRCWRRINAKEGGWLQKEFRDGLAWRLLLFQAENFASDKSNYLSKAMTEAGAIRLTAGNEAWSKRYDDGWSKVKALVDASREHWKQVEEKEEANRQKDIEDERLRAEAAERSAVLARRRTRRSQLVSLASICAAIAIAAYANYDWLKEKVYGLANTSALNSARERALKPGNSFKECRDCPEMVVLPAGKFRMGVPPDQGSEFEHPEHKVTIARPFAVSKFELTFDAWDACAAYGDCDPRVKDRWGRGQQPVINVSWDDVQTYVKWLSRITGKAYRLLSESEYEYAARAGSETKYPWGDEIERNGQAMANCKGCGSQWDDKQTAPVGSFFANAFGLYDMVGNLWEWTEDCWRDNYKGAPDDGLPWTVGDCSRRVVRGGAWNHDPDKLRSAYPLEIFDVSRGGDLGFRVARTLSP